jgi:butyryl-CoA dehydrogenase
VVAWLWLEQVLALGDEDGDFAEGKRAAARWFARWELPAVRPLLDRLAALDRTVLDTRPSWL